MTRRRKAYGKTVHWADKNDPKNEQLRGFRAEAEKLLGVRDNKS
jgi:hypothetical protein